MERKMTVGHQLKVTGNRARRLAEASIPVEMRCEVTEGQGRVLGFLYHNRDRAVFQRDVEAEFSITRATASKTLSAMERGGLICRRSVEEDARLKRLELTEKAMEHMHRIHRGMVEFERELVRGMTEEEQRTLLALLEKVERNAEEALGRLRSGKENTR